MKPIVLVPLLLITTIFDANDVYSKSILEENKAIARYEKRMNRCVKKLLNEDVEKVEKVTFYYCNYVGELVPDSLSSKTLIYNIEVCYDRFPRNKLIEGHTYLFPNFTDDIISYSHWNNKPIASWERKRKGNLSKMEIVANESIERKKTLLRVCNELNIDYCINMGINDIWSMFEILIDTEGNSYLINDDVTGFEYYPLADKADDIINYWNERDYAE